MYAAMAFLATLASDYRKQPAVRIMPDHRKALARLIHGAGFSGLAAVA
jgi:hypothetical protein